MNTNMHAGKTMEGITENGGGRRWSPWKIAVWAAPALFMLLILVAMQFDDEVNWTASDFVFAAVVLYGALGAYELVTRMAGNTTYRAGVGVGIAALVLLVWGNGAVGITDTDADGWYGVVLVVGIIGAFLARFRAPWMALALFATALTMALVSVIALVVGMVGADNSAPEILGITAFYVALFAGSALLFREAARGEPERGAV